MLKELTRLARKGIVIELALAIVVAQFASSILTSFIYDVLVPPIGLLLGGRSVPSLFLNLTPNKVTPQGGPIDSIEKARYAGAPVIAYGSFLLDLFAFIVVAMVAVAVLRWLRKMNAVDADATGAWPPAPHGTPLPSRDPQTVPDFEA